MTSNLIDSLNFQSRVIAAQAITKSISQLAIGKKYNIFSLTEVNTKYGISIRAIISRESEEEEEEEDEDEDENEEENTEYFSIFLPKWVKISKKEIEDYNRGPRKMKLTYRGMINKSFNINFS